jgi:long-chain acyl-CoA synthetase
MRAAPETEIALVDPQGQSVQSGEMGEMLVRSSSTMLGYWQAPGQIDRLPDGWLHTGDLATLEHDGQYRFVGRVNDLIIRGGSNISPVEIEGTLLSLPEVADAGVAGLADPVLGQRVVAAVVLGRGSVDATPEAIRTKLQAILADYRIPERIILLDSIPRNALGKIERKQIAGMFE